MKQVSFIALILLIVGGLLTVLCQGDVRLLLVLSATLLFLVGYSDNSSYGMDQLTINSLFMSPTAMYFGMIVAVHFPYVVVKGNLAMLAPWNAMWILIPAQFVGIICNLVVERKKHGFPSF